MSSIFSYERRDTIAQMNRRSLAHALTRRVGLLILIGILGFIAWRTVAPAIAAGPAPLQPVVLVNGERTDLMTLCAQYRSDKLMTGQKMEGETAKLCGFTD